MKTWSRNQRWTTLRNASVAILAWVLLPGCAAAPRASGLGPDDVRKMAYDLAGDAAYDLARSKFVRSYVRENQRQIVLASEEELAAADGPLRELREEVLARLVRDEQLSPYVDVVDLVIDAGAARSIRSGDPLFAEAAGPGYVLPYAPDAVCTLGLSLSHTQTPTGPAWFAQLSISHARSGTSLCKTSTGCGALETEPAAWQLDEAADGLADELARELPHAGYVQDLLNRSSASIVLRPGEMRSHDQTTSHRALRRVLQRIFDRLALKGGLRGRFVMQPESSVADDAAGSEEFVISLNAVYWDTTRVIERPQSEIVLTAESDDGRQLWSATSKIERRGD